MNKYSRLSICSMGSGALPATATLLVLAASVLAAGLVAYFLFEYNRRALQQPSLTVLWAVAYAGSEGGVDLYIAVENTGRVPVNLDNSVVVLPLREGSVELKLAKGGGILRPGERATLVYRGAAKLENVLEGGLATLVTGGCQASFPVAKP